VRPLGAGRADNLQPAGEGVALGEAAVRLLLRRGCVLREPDLDAELAPVAPRRTLVRPCAQEDRLRRRQARERLGREADRIDQDAAAVGGDRVRGRDVPADVRVVDPPVPDLVGDELDPLSDLARFGHVADLSIGWTSWCGGG
jgi:hypothetical protein